MGNLNRKQWGQLITVALVISWGSQSLGWDHLLIPMSGTWARKTKLETSSKASSVQALIVILILIHSLSLSLLLSLPPSFPPFPTPPHPTPQCMVFPA